MSRIINNQLIELASEFATIRQSGKKNYFPDAIWQKAFSIAQRLSIKEVCRVIKVHPAYFRKKMGFFKSQIEEQSITFLELIAHKPNTITIRIESSHGHKLSVESMAISDLVPVLSEFLKGGASCCK